MFSYFNKNDPFRIVGLIMILLITRVSFFLFFKDDSWTIEAVSDDLLTSDTLHSAPLFNLLIVGLSTLSSELLDLFLASLLILLNAIQLNSIFLRNASFQENTYLPASIYIILLSASSDFYYLSPELVGSSFLLITLNYLFYHVKYRGTEENILSTGFTIGLAGLCYYPFVWAYLIVLLIYLLYSGTIRRRYFLMTWGFILPFLITWLIYFLFSSGTEFLNTLFTQVIYYQILGELLESSFLVYGAGLALSLIAAIQSFSGQGMTNHQILVQKSISWVGFFGLILFAIFAQDRIATLVLALTGMAYFTTKMVSSLSKKFVAEILFIGLFGLSIATMILGY